MSNNSAIVSEAGLITLVMRGHVTGSKTLSTVQTLYMHSRTRADGFERPVIFWVDLGISNRLRLEVCTGMGQTSPRPTYRMEQR